MSESELSISYSDLIVEVAAFLGYGPDSTAWSKDQIAECDRHIQTGVRRFYYPPATGGAEVGYQWSFLSPTTTLATVADAKANDLPAGLARVLGDFYFKESDHQRSIVQISEGHYQQHLSRTETAGYPRFALVRYKMKADEAIGHRLEVLWWPVPNAAYTLTYQYEAYNGKLSKTLNPYPLGGMRHAEVITQACLAVAEQRSNDERGIQTEEYERSLLAAIQQDRRMGARYFGHMGSFEETLVVPRHGDTGGTYPITYNGVDVDA